MPAAIPLALRVGFNAALLSPTRDYRAAGIHRYIEALLTALAGRDGLTLTAFTADPGAAALLPSSIDVRRLPAWSSRPFARILWEQAFFPFALGAMRADLVHGPAYAMPRWGRRPAVVTVHDLAPFRLPDTFPKLQGAYLRSATRHAVRRAKALIAVSAFTARELVDVLRADPERIHVVHNGLDRDCRPRPEGEVDAYRARAGLPGRFILSLGTLQPRKNLGRLLEAYAEMVRRDPAVAPLVVAGPPGWGRESVPERLMALGLGERVRLLGYVEPDDLPLLYNAATVLAFPSRYEGFGLPVLEAMACGTPVVVAEGSSLTEVAPHAPHVAPDDVAGWAAALGALMDDEAARAELSDLGFQRAVDFSWDRAADETADVYRQAAESSPALGQATPLRTSLHA